MDINYQDYAKMLKVLSDETRLQIMDMLKEGELCACDLLMDFDITQPTLSYHMKLLRDAGLVNSRKEGNKVLYSVNDGTLVELKNLFSDMVTQTIT